MKTYNKEYLTQRILEIIPGALTWSILLLPLTLGFFAPGVVIFVLTFFAFYWFYTVFMGLFHVLIGYKKYKDEMFRNWYKELKELDWNKLKNKKTLPASLKDLKHFILIPIYAEPYEVLDETFDHIYKSTFPKDKITLVFAVEERNHKRVISDLNKLREKYDKKHLADFMTFVHPAGIEGEVIGVAGANRNWAARKAVDSIKESGKNLNDYIFTTFDSDTQINPQFLARVAYAYVTTPKRRNRFYETVIHVFDNNTWRVPILNRVSADSITIALMASWSAPSSPFVGQLMNTFSCYSVSLKTLIKADFWDPAVGIDDSIFFIRALKALKGDFSGIPMYIPIHLDVAEGSSYIDSHRSMYKQQLRWGWGVIDFPMLIKMFPNLKKADIFEKIAHLWVKIELFVVLRTIGFLLVSGLFFLTLVNPTYGQMNYAYSIPKINSVMLGLTFGGFIPVFYIKHKLKRVAPGNWGITRKVINFAFEYIMLYISMLTFGFFPWIEAQTKLMFGKKFKKLYVTPKFR
jgi:hypothetical protein